MSFKKDLREIGIKFLEISDIQESHSRRIKLSELASFCFKKDESFSDFNDN